MCSCCEDKGCPVIPRYWIHSQRVVSCALLRIICFWCAFEQVCVSTMCRWQKVEYSTLKCSAASDMNLKVPLAWRHLLSVFWSQYWPEFAVTLPSCWNRFAISYPSSSVQNRLRNVPSKAEHQWDMELQLCHSWSLFGALEMCSSFQRDCLHILTRNSTGKATKAPSNAPCPWIFVIPSRSTGSGTQSQIFYIYPISLFLH